MNCERANGVRYFSQQGEELHAGDRGETRIATPGKGLSGVACLSATALKPASMDVDCQMAFAPADNVACVHLVRACALITVSVPLVAICPAHRSWRIVRKVLLATLSSAGAQRGGIRVFLLPKF